MASLTVTLPSQREQTAYNLRRWAELVDDPELARIEGRVETNRHGQVIMSLPPAPRHGSYQCRIAILLDGLMKAGRVYTECPISTADGVKAADVAWASSQRVEALGDAVCFARAPEICVEVISARNTADEMREKTLLYLDAGAIEVWHCEESGAMRFFRTGGTPQSESGLCPDFPSQVQLR